MPFLSLSPHWQAGFLALGLTLGLMPLVRWVALRREWGLDRPNHRKVHTGAVPRLGGAALSLGWLAGVGLGWILAPGNGLGSRYWGIVLGGVLLVGVGMIDDLRPGGWWKRLGLVGEDGLRPAVKGLGQLAAAAIPVSFGVGIEGFVLPWTDKWLGLGPVGNTFWTIVWIGMLTNAVNWLDGLDGLAGGISFISAATLTTIALLHPPRDPAAALFLLALAGSVLGFLPFNFSTRFKIFMGDAGAMFLGYLLATVSVAGAMKTTTLLAVGAPLAVGIPMVDFTQTILSRLRHHQSIFQADNRHVHNRLLRAGWSPREAVFLLYALSALLNSAVLAMLGLNTASAMVSILVAGLILFLCVRRRPGEGDLGGTQGI